MKKFMQVGLFMGTFLLSSQLFGQTAEKRGELAVCPKGQAQSEGPQVKNVGPAKKSQKVMKAANFKAAVPARKETH